MLGGAVYRPVSDCDVAWCLAIDPYAPLLKKFDNRLALPEIGLCHLLTATHQGVHSLDKCGSANEVFARPA